MRRTGGFSVNKRPRRALLVVLVLVLQLLAACGGGRDGESQESRAPVEATRLVRVVGGEYFFRAPARLPAGVTTFSFENVGKETHEMKLFRVTEGTTLKEAQAVWGHQGTTIFIGKTSQLAPGEKATITRLLRPGAYMLACAVRTPGRRYHFYRGMTSSFKVPA